MAVFLALCYNNQPIKWLINKKYLLPYHYYCTYILKDFLVNNILCVFLVIRVLFGVEDCQYCSSSYTLNRNNVFTTSFSASALSNPFEPSRLTLQLIPTSLETPFSVLYQCLQTCITTSLKSYNLPPSFFLLPRIEFLHHTLEYPMNSP